MPMSPHYVFIAMSWEVIMFSYKNACNHYLSLSWQKFSSWFMFIVGTNGLAVVCLYLGKKWSGMTLYYLLKFNMRCRDLHCHLIGYKSKKVVPGTSSIAGPAHQMPPPLRTSTGTRQAKLVNHGKSTLCHLLSLAETFWSRSSTLFC